jgi:hypothetical protein
MPSSGRPAGKYGHNIDKDRCAVCGGTVVLVDGPVRRWDQWWDAGDWIHCERRDTGHKAVPTRVANQFGYMPSSN